MFTYDHLQFLLKTRPFVPFRLVLSDGGAVEVPSPEVALVGRRFAVIGFLDPKNDTLISRWTTIWYMHVSRVEQLGPGQPPFTAPPDAESPSPSPV